MGHNPVAVAAIVRSNSNRSTLPELSMSFDSNKRHSRHSSTISQYFDASEQGEEDDSPPLSALDSSTALILVHDDEEEESPLPFTDDEDERENDDELVTPMFELRRSAVFPPLQPSLVLLYLLAPHLRLGALNIPYTPLPLKYGLPTLLLSALATAFTRQIWYMLARYIRKANVTDVLMDTFARGRENERRRLAIRALVKTSTGSLGVFLSIVYLRCKLHHFFNIKLLSNNKSRFNVHIMSNLRSRRPSESLLLLFCSPGPLCCSILGICSVSELPKNHLRNCAISSFIHCVVGLHYLCLLKGSVTTQGWLARFRRYLARPWYVQLLQEFAFLAHILSQLP
jgi:hypothetical protein